MGCTASSTTQELSFSTRNGGRDTLPLWDPEDTGICSEHEEFKLVGISGEAIRGKEVFLKTVNHKG